MHKLVGIAAFTSAVASLAFVAPAHADDAPPSPHAYRQLGTAAQQQMARQHNQTSTLSAPADWRVVRPFSEAEHTGFVAISGEAEFELPALREAIAKNLPADASLVVYVNDASMAPDLQKQIGPSLGDRLKFLTIPDGGDDPLWARDALPFPVYLAPAAPATGATFGLVASLYPQGFDPNDAISEALSLRVQRTNVYFRGGNLLFDEKGNCFAENAGEVASLSDPKDFFTSYFGCATVTILDREGGIGDIDERIKFLAGNVAVTDDDAYATLLTSRGYDVKRVPRTGSDLETYMNTLLVNGTIFVPQMGIAADEDALKAYRELGLKPVGVFTKELADNDGGNIHCLTMNYPPGTFKPNARNAAFVEFAAATAHPVRP